MLLAIACVRILPCQHSTTRVTCSTTCIPYPTAAVTVLAWTASEPSCTNGLPGYDGTNSNGSVCCPVRRGGCGGKGCGKFGEAEGFTRHECCINGLLRTKPDCSDSAAPCIMGRNLRYDFELNRKSKSRCWCSQGPKPFVGFLGGDK